MIRQRTLDVSELSASEFGHTNLIWWGTVGFMVIEGAMFVMAIIVYFYLRLKVEAWPPNQPNPDLFWGTVNLAVVFASAVPNLLAKRAAERFDLRSIRIWLTILILFGVVNVVLRGVEYAFLNCRWDDNAYGSIVWLLLSLHTIHIATDVVDSVVLLALMIIGPTPHKRFVDVSENSLYWFYIIAWWVPIYVTIYLAPRWL